MMMMSPGDLQVVLPLITTLFTNILFLLAWSAYIPRRRSSLASGAWNPEGPLDEDQRREQAHLITHIYIHVHMYIYIYTHAYLHFSSIPRSPTWCQKVPEVCEGCTFQAFPQTPTWCQKMANVCEGCALQASPKIQHDVTKRLECVWGGCTFPAFQKIYKKNKACSAGLFA